MKKLVKIFLAILFLVLAVQPIRAVDLTVTCDPSINPVNDACEMSPFSGEALFNETDVKPGDSFSQRITVNNDDVDDCPLVLSVTEVSGPSVPDFAGVLFTAINDGSTHDFFGNTVGGQAGSGWNLRDLFNVGSIGLGTVPANDTNVYDWLVNIDTSVGNDYQEKSLEFDFDLVFSCEEPGECPDLTIEKDNDRKDDVLSDGDLVNYTIVVTNNGPETLSSVVVKDVQPVGDYFDYQTDSGHLSCTDGTEIDLNPSGSNPYYWALGEMIDDEVCTLTYQMEVLSVAIPGEHNNLAVAYGESSGRTCYSGVVQDPIQVGTEALGGSFSGQVLGAMAKVGEVLGAATGSRTFWLVLALLLVVAGLGLILLRNSLAKILRLLLALVLSSSVLLGTVGTVWAAGDLVVSVVKLPEYFNKNSFEISYTALEAGGVGLKDVKVEYKKEGDSWQDLGTYTEESRKVSVNSSQINEDNKKYYFRATACDNDSHCVADETSTNIDMTVPPKPENYSKEKIGVQSYKIKWHNPDSDDLVSVYIYRSDQRSFDANDDTKVVEVPVSKNTDSEWTDPVVPDASKEYYYVIRSVDKAGNGSDLVGDVLTSYTTTEEVAGVSTTGQEVTGQETVAGQELVAQEAGETGAAAEDEEKTEEEEGQILGGETEAVGLAKELRERNWFLILGVAGAGGLGALAIGYWLYKKRG